MPVATSASGPILGNIMKHGISANFAVTSKEPLTDCIDKQDRFDRSRSSPVLRACSHATRTWQTLASVPLSFSVKKRRKIYSRLRPAVALSYPSPTSPPFLDPNDRSEEPKTEEPKPPRVQSAEFYRQSRSLTRARARGRPKTKGREVHFKVDTAFLPSLPSLHSFLFDPSQLCCRLSRSLRQIRHPTNTQHNSNGSRETSRSPTRTQIGS